MVRICSVKRLDVQGDPGIHRERLEELAYQLGIERPDLVPWELRAEHEERSSRDVDRRPRKRLVHRQHGVGIAGDAGALAQRLTKRLAEGDAGVLDRMVVVDMQVALRRDVHVDKRVACELVEHVVEEADAGRDRTLARAIEGDGDGDRRFLGLARDGRGAHGASSCGGSPRS